MGWLIGVCFIWLWTWSHLARDWANYEQYQYGFVVPFLAFFICWRRMEIPSEKPSSSGFVVLVAGVAWLLFVIGELLRWRDPFWRLSGAVLQVSAVALTAAWLLTTGGAAGLRRQLFTLGFTFLALPWPKPLELEITQGLMGLVTRFAVAAANLCGIAALQSGNTIELTTGLIGVDTACSGLQSLQAMLMASVFLGELNCLTASRRCVLSAIGAALALITNFVRVFGLAIISHHLGHGAFARFHDAVGMSATVCAFGGLWAIASMLRTSGSFEPTLIVGKWNHLRIAGGWGIVVAFTLVPLGAFSTFRTTTTSSSSVSPLWHLSPERLPPGWAAQKGELSSRERESLRFIDGERWTFQTPQGTQMQAVHLSWIDGPSLPVTAFRHSPSFCLPSLGWSQIGPGESTSIKIKDKSVVFLKCRFEREHQTVVVLQNLVTGRTCVDPREIYNAPLFGVERFAQLWSRSASRITEELLIYLPVVKNVETQPDILRLIEVSLDTANMKPGTNPSELTEVTR